MAQSGPDTTIHARAKSQAIQPPRLKPQVWFERSIASYPESGWNHAIEGLAIKLAQRLGYEPCMVCYGEAIDPPPKGVRLIQMERANGPSQEDTYEVINRYLQKHGAPAIWFGSYGKGAGPLGNLSYRCNARPDLGVAWDTPAITHLTPQRIQQAGQRGAQLPEWQDKLHGKKVLITLGEVELLGFADSNNPLLSEVQHLLAEQDDLTLMITSSPRTQQGDYTYAIRYVEELVKQAQASGKRISLIAQSYQECADSAYMARTGRGTEIPNRYEEMLGIADAVMILGVSRSMLGDALLSDAAIYLQNTPDPKPLPAAVKFQRGIETVFGEQAKGRIAGGSFEGQTIEKPKGTVPLDITEHFVDEIVREYESFCHDHEERVPLQTQTRAR